ncbi:MAG: hypothetical protein WD552_01655 [Candidatus Paceibacterota bacterium]
MKLRTILQIAVGLLIFILIAGYSIYQARDFWAGPTLAISTPADGVQTTHPLIHISGAAERISFLSLNGRQIYTDPNGRFSEALLLTPGYNIITLAADDSFGRHTEKHLRVVLNATSSLLFSSYKINNGQEERRTTKEDQETEE